MWPVFEIGMSQNTNFNSLSLSQMSKTSPHTHLLCNPNVFLVCTSPKSDVRKSSAMSNIQGKILAKLPV